MEVVSIKKLKGFYILGEEFYPAIYAESERIQIAKLVDIYAPLQSVESLRANPEILAPCEVMFSGWGGPPIDEWMLERAPNLKLVLYGGGSAWHHITEALWERGIMLSSAYAANAQPVVEYTLSAILLSLKHFWRFAEHIRKNGSYPTKHVVPGGYNSTVGLVSMGMIARMLTEKLRLFDLNILAYDPFLSPAEAADLGVELVSLEELFVKSDVVSLHSPALSETIGIIHGKLISSMKEGASLINTARGSLIREAELIEVARVRSDLQFVLDCTSPEPPRTGSPLFTLPNVVLTPHIAGSMSGECRRLGLAMVEELERFVSGQPLKWVITKELAQTSSHRPIFLDNRGVPDPAENGSLTIAEACPS